MSDDYKPSLKMRFLEWLFTRCFAYCAWFAFPGAVPDECSIIDHRSQFAIDYQEYEQIKQALGEDVLANIRGVDYI